MAAAVDLKETIDQYRLAQKEFVKGNPGPFKEVCSHANDVTIMGGWGGSKKDGLTKLRNAMTGRRRALLLAATMRRMIENISLVIHSRDGLTA